MRIILRGTVLLLSLCPSVSVWGQASQPVDAGQGEPVTLSLVDPVLPTMANRAKLAEKIVTVDFDQAPLDAVLRFVAENSDANLEVDWNALALYGVERERVVTVQMSKVPMRQVLDAALLQASADLGIDEGIEVGFVGERVIVSTCREIKWLGRQTWVYDIGDIVEGGSILFPDHYKISEARFRAFFGRPVPPDLLASVPATAPAGEDDDAYIEPTAEEKLVDFVWDSVGTPTDWLDEQYTCRVRGHALVLTATPDIHLELRQLLAKVRALRPPRSTEQQMRDRMVQHHLAEAEILRREGKYEAAAEQADVALRLSPDDEFAQAMQKLIAESRPAAE